jgi:hypothetical protein
VCCVFQKSQSFPAFDGILWNGAQWFPLQVTIDATKHLKPDLLKAFWTKHQKALGDTKLRWYGVLPPSIAQRKTAFRYENSGDVGWARSNVDQFVIPFPRLDDPPIGFSDEETKVLVDMKHEMFSKRKID